MTRKPFSVSVRRLPALAILDLQGEIDSFAEQDLNAAYAQADSYGLEKIVLNFQEVEYINSTGIALIVGLLAQARKRHRSLAVYGLSEHYVEIFNITRLSDFMTIYPDEQSVFSLG